ncbi:MAG TPA: ATP-dependent DNA helicase RecG [Jiangellaceae bacterium]|nr:ATP-dependent DNA helicase RecG [Jiangellaceae bacterium]
MPAAWDEPLDRVVGRQTAKALATGLDIRTVGDLMRHYPRRYAERGQLTDLDSLHLDEQVTVLAMVEDVRTRSMKTRKGGITEVVVTDGSGRLVLTFFNQRWRERDLQKGRIGLFAGKVGVYRRQRQLAHPDYVLLPEGTDVTTAAEEFADRLIPVYAATANLATWKIASCVRVVLDTLGAVPDPIPPAIRRRMGLMDAESALRTVHRPASRDDAERARHRLRFEEAFVLQAELARRRESAAALPAVPRKPVSGGLLDALDARLPFRLTQGQIRVGDEIAADLARDHPMHRLLQGEVGTGKTVVALRAMLAVVDTGGQAVLLAPTEVLAQQHLRSLRDLLGPLGERGLLGGSEVGTRVTLVTGSMGTSARREALLDSVSGEAGIVVGTHALLEERVQFADLGLVVVDEQHRFGVEQRSALAAKGAGDVRPHVLVMTATPIPRTVAMTVFGDLWVSTLSELPAGRADVATHLIPVDEKPHYLERAWTRVREEVARGNQVYVVCPRIGGDAAEPDNDSPADGDDTGRRPIAVLDLVEMLRAGPLAGIEIEVLHGRLGPEAKDQVMRRFTSGEAPVLVATTVIEVGVDVSTASTMVVMDADRFGVSQLHQLRGRIGRGDVPGLCLLVTDAPSGTPARERLEAVASTRDGFALARVDLEQRREGDVLGAAQSGRRSSLRLLSVIHDENLILAAREAASLYVADDPELRRWQPLSDAVAALSGDERADYLEKA